MDALGCGLDGRGFGCHENAGTQSEALGLGSLRVVPVSAGHGEDRAVGRGGLGGEVAGSPCHQETGVGGREGLQGLMRPRVPQWDIEMKS